MSYYDKTFGNVLPTRNGAATGTANERQMLDRIGGSAGYRKQFQTNPDGSTTMLTTKNGMPQFTTYGATVAVITTSLADVYMESGQLEWSFPGELNPARLDPAKWHFLDIPTNADYLGYVNKSGLQNNYPVLAESQESQAIGYKKAILTPTSTPAQIAAAALADSASKAASNDMLLIKKLVTGFFPASLFTGKMRLFMQAQYGALDGVLPYPFVVDLVGESVLLYYNQGGRSLQLGFWYNKTPGIFTAHDGSYWLMDIAMSGPTIHINACPIVHATEVSALVTRLKTDDLSDDEHTKLEAYVFAYSYVDLVNSVHLVAGGATGGTMAYGWKFNAQGDEARIVMHESSGEGVTAKWNSKTITLSFGYSDGAVTVQSSVAGNGDWMDGWGTFNIFVPDSETSAAPLNHYSVTAGFPRPNFDFPVTEIYGYYDQDDAWVSVTVSRSTDPGPFPRTEMSESGVVFAPGVDMNAANRYTYAVLPASSGGGWSVKYTYGGTAMTLSVGDKTYTGSASSVFKSVGERRISANGSQANGADFAPDSGAWLPGSWSPLTLPLFPGWNSEVPPYGTITLNRTTIETWGYTGYEFFSWTLVIPAGDAAAAYVATRHFEEPSGSPTHSTRTFTEPNRIYGRTAGGFGQEPADYDVTCYVGLASGGSWYGVSPEEVFTTDNAPLPTKPVSVDCFNTVLNGSPGAPGGSYETLFTVDVGYPFYNRGMFTYTSAGGRYAMSEGLTSPVSVNYQHRFVGWA